MVDCYPEDRGCKPLYTGYTRLWAGKGMGVVRARSALKFSSLLQPREDNKNNDSLKGGQCPQKPGGGGRASPLRKFFLPLFSD